MRIPLQKSLLAVYPGGIRGPVYWPYWPLGRFGLWGNGPIGNGPTGNGIQHGCASTARGGGAPYCKRFACPAEACSEPRGSEPCRLGGSEAWQLGGLAARRLGDLEAWWLGGLKALGLGELEARRLKGFEALGVYGFVGRSWGRVPVDLGRSWRSWGGLESSWGRLRASWELLGWFGVAL